MDVGLAWRRDMELSWSFRRRCSLSDPIFGRHTICPAGDTVRAPQPASLAMQDDRFHAGRLGIRVESAIPGRDESVIVK